MADELGRDRRPLRPDLVRTYGVAGARMIQFGPDDDGGARGPQPATVGDLITTWRGLRVPVEGAVTVAEATEAAPERTTAMVQPENPLRGLRLCVTGKVGSYVRDDLYLRLNRLGANASDRIDSTTDYLVVGDRPGAAKRTAARRYGTPEVSATWLLGRIERAQEAQSWSAAARVDTSAQDAEVARTRDLLGTTERAQAGVTSADRPALARAIGAEAARLADRTTTAPARALAPPPGPPTPVPGARPRRERRATKEGF